MICWGAYLASSGWSWTGKEGRDCCGLRRRWHTLTKTWWSWDDCCRSGLAFQAGYCRLLWSYMVWPQSFCVFSLSEGKNCWNGTGVGTYTLYPAPRTWQVLVIYSVEYSLKTIAAAVARIPALYCLHQNIWKYKYGNCDYKGIENYSKEQNESW